ncbi:MAG: 3-phosphoshikimate 1-carboxyvinyltransferase [Thermoleophilia bacterium]
MIAVNNDMVHFAPSGALRGSVAVPSDKSITQRALIIGALSSGDVLVRAPLWAGDTEATAAMLAELGVRIERGASETVVHGVGLRGLKRPPQALDARNSGTAMRLLSGVLAGQSGRFVIDGDESLRRRPMDRVVLPLRLMGARIEARDDRFAPLAIDGCWLTGITYQLPVASAQIKSCLLLAGLLANGETRIIEPLPSRDHSERMLAAAGVTISGGSGWCALRPPAELHLAEVRVPGDPSSAAFLAAAATVVPGSCLEVHDVGLNPTRLGFYEVLKRMGADVTWQVREQSGGEPIGALVVRSATLHGVTVGSDEVPLLIDELPLVALMGAFAVGKTEVNGAAELKVKESDRLAAIGRIIGTLGGRVTLTDDGFTVYGGELRGGRVDSEGDHRLALLGAVAGLACPDGVTVAGFTAAAVSFPGFRDLLNTVLI